MVAFAVLAIARAIRLGRPVREPEQVPIAGSELVAATGRLSTSNPNLQAIPVRTELGREIDDKGIVVERHHESACAFHDQSPVASGGL